MKHVLAAVGGVFVAIVVYMAIWFFARNMVEGQLRAIQNAVDVVSIVISLAAGFSSYRGTLRRFSS